MTNPDMKIYFVLCTSYDDISFSAVMRQHLRHLLEFSGKRYAKNVFGFPSIFKGE